MSIVADECRDKRRKGGGGAPLWSAVTCHRFSFAGTKARRVGAPCALNRHRRCLDVVLKNNPILTNRADIQHTCLQIEALLRISVFGEEPDLLKLILQCLQTNAPKLLGFGAAAGVTGRGLLERTPGDTFTLG